MSRSKLKLLVILKQKTKLKIVNQHGAGCSCCVGKRMNRQWCYETLNIESLAILNWRAGKSKGSYCAYRASCYSWQVKFSAAAI